MASGINAGPRAFGSQTKNAVLLSYVRLFRAPILLDGSRFLLDESLLLLDGSPLLLDGSPLLLDGSPLI